MVHSRLRSEEEGTGYGCLAAWAPLVNEVYEEDLAEAEYIRVFMPQAPESLEERRG